MKPEIHPAYHEVAYVCGCGNVIKTGSTHNKDTIHVDICSKCHPFYTGKQRLSDAGGRLNRFRQKYAQQTSAKTGNSE